MAIVKYKNQSGVTYAYEQTSVYDHEKKQSRPVRKYLGRVDPETGEIVSTKGKRGRPPKQANSTESNGIPTQDYKTLYEQKCKELEISQKELSQTIKEKDRLLACMNEISQALASIQSRISSTTEQG